MWVVVKTDKIKCGWGYLGDSTNLKAALNMVCLNKHPGNRKKKVKSLSVKGGRT